MDSTAGTTSTSTSTTNTKTTSQAISNSETPTLSSGNQLPPHSTEDDDSDDTLLSLSFNQDGGCLAAGTTKGFRICNVFPFQETFRRTFVPSPNPTSNPTNPSTHPSERRRTNGGGIGNIEMLFRCNLLALVGGGPDPHYAPNKVIIWDDHCGRPIGDRTFRQRVLTVRLRRDRICVALSDRVYVYNFANFELLDTIVTGGDANGAGLLCISTDAGDGGGSLMPGRDDAGMVLACPSLKRGQVRVELYGRRKTVLIDAHDGALAAMALSVDGGLLATASERGTIVRLFETGERADEGGDVQSVVGTPLREFRRGVEQAKIGCLCFSLDKAWLGCASDRGTVHVFQVKKEDTGQRTRPSLKQSITTSTASKLARSFLPSVITKSTRTFLLEGENSYAQVRGISQPHACAFVPHQHNTIAVAGMDDYGNGCLLLATFGPQDEQDLDGQDHLQHDKRGSQHPINESSDQSQNTKGEVRRVAFHRFFKKGMSVLAKKNCNSGTRGDEGHLLFSDKKDNGEYFMDGTTEQIIFGDEDEDDGFVSVKSDYQAGAVLEEKKIDLGGAHDMGAIGKNDGVKQEKKEVETRLVGSSENEKIGKTEIDTSQ